MDTSRLLLLARLSLALVWIFTGLTSLFFQPEIGFSVLSRAGVDCDTASLLIISGSMLDILLGFWVLSGYQLKWCCYLQIAIMATYSILLTFIDASFWLHPFGPLTKNFPMAVLVLFTLFIQNESKLNKNS